ncbi:cytochrome P450 87A3-like [Carex rostrata]
MQTILTQARRVVTIILKNTLNKRMSSPQVRYVDFWDKLVEELTNKESIITESIALDSIFALFLAGFEATSYAITLAFKLLSDHPQVIEKLEEEHEQILKKMGDREDSSTVTWEDYKSMIFTSQVIKEILRLGNFSPVMFRKTMKDVEYKGYTIPKGWQVMVCSLAIHLNPEIYEDPHSFKPSRWKFLKL